VPAESKKILLLNVVERVCHKCAVRAIPSISKCFLEKKKIDNEVRHKHNRDTRACSAALDYSLMQRDCRRTSDT